MFTRLLNLHRHLLFTVVLAALCAACAPDGRDPSDPQGSTAEDAVQDDSASVTAASRCSVTPSNVTCSSHKLTLLAQLLPRDVHYEVPLGSPPPGGFPVVIFFQGSFVPASRAFQSSILDPFGQYNLSLTVKALLDAGYAVLAPNALSGGTTFWQTNVAPWNVFWSTSSDDAFMKAIFKAISDGRFGPVAPVRLYAMGISSGGFMTSRMAVSYPGKFRALAVHSGSYATCSSLCVVPVPLPSNHPPTLFLHGGSDLIIPIETMELYRDELQREGRVVDSVVNEATGHEWLAEGPDAIVGWFNAHL
jgi:poly(3-hydroxyoctanoate) depolymerase